MAEKRVEVLLEYQNYIETPPVAPKSLYAQSCSSDEVTINSWRPTWISNVRANHKKYGPFKDRSIIKFFNKEKYKPVIIAGSGPSLKRNGKHLKNKGEIALVSCLHNFHFMEDQGIDVDYYMTLDAGEITVEEVYEGGSKTPDEYWELTKNRKLLAFIGTSPRLLEKWQGEIIFFNAPVPDEAYTNAVNELEEFPVYISNGGNVLGACLYFAKAYLGAGAVGFVGADFAFSYDKKFHGWDSKYDANLGYVLKTVDVFGNKVLTWQSYANFKAWFDYVAMVVPGIWINCTEGGTFGAYPEGNIMAIRQMDLTDFIEMYNINDAIKECITNLKTEQRLLF